MSARRTGLLFVVVVLLIVPTPVASQSDSAQFSCNENQTAATASPAQVDIDYSIQNGPPFHGFYGAFPEYDGTLLIISVRNLGASSDIVPVKLSVGEEGDVEAELYVHQGGILREMERSEFNITREQERTGLYGQSYCLRTVPHTSYVVAFTLSPVYFINHPFDTPPDSESGFIGAQHSYYNGTEQVNGTFSQEVRLPIHETSLSESLLGITTLDNLMRTIGFVTTILSFLVTISPTFHKRLKVILQRLGRWPIAIAGTIRSYIANSILRLGRWVKGSDE